MENFTEILSVIVAACNLGIAYLLKGLVDTLTELVMNMSNSYNSTIRMIAEILKEENEKFNGKTRDSSSKTE